MSAQAVASRNSLISEYESLVPALAGSLMKRFVIQPALYEELCSAGYLGLVEAADRCSPDLLASFRSYAAIRIRGAMIDMLRNHSVLSRRSHRFVKAMYALQHVREDEFLEQTYGSDTQKDPRKRMAQVLETASKGALAFRLSVEEAREELDTVEAKDLPLEQQLHLRRLRSQLEECISRLTEKEQIIIRQYYFEDRSFVDIASTNIGMNKSWISKLHSRALGKLRAMLDAETI